MFLTAHHLTVAYRQLVVCEGLVIGQKLRISYLATRKRPIGLANTRLEDLIRLEIKLRARAKRIQAALHPH